MQLWKHRGDPLPGFQHDFGIRVKTRFFIEAVSGEFFAYSSVDIPSESRQRSHLYLNGLPLLIRVSFYTTRTRMLIYGALKIFFFCVTPPSRLGKRRLRMFERFSGASMQKAWSGSYKIKCYMSVTSVMDWAFPGRRSSRPRIYPSWRSIAVVRAMRSNGGEVIG